MAQTLREIEVICIDDGSTDGSGKIADEYESNEFPIFRVIHTENRGLSAARNRGIDEATAEWIMFVDSDDWVEPDFCRVPYEAAIENQADLVIFGAYQTTESGRVCKTKTSIIQSGVAGKEDVIMNSVAWNKLYHRDLFYDIRYPEGHVYEDIATTHMIIHRAERIYRCKERFYYRRKRRGSITKSSQNSADAYTASIKRHKDLVGLGYMIEGKDSFLQAVSLDYCGQAARNDELLYQTAVDVVKTIDKTPDEFDTKYRVKLLIWRFNKHVYRWIYHICGKQMKQ